MRTEGSTSSDQYEYVYDVNSIDNLMCNLNWLDNRDDEVEQDGVLRPHEHCINLDCQENPSWRKMLNIGNDREIYSGYLYNFNTSPKYRGHIWLVKGYFSIGLRLPLLILAIDVMNHPREHQIN